MLPNAVHHVYTGMMNKEQKSAYNRAYLAANRDRIAANRAARRAGERDGPRCTIEGCGGVHDTQGLCGRHYQAFLRHGDPTVVVQTQHHGLTLEERFFSYVERGPDCWDWTGVKSPKGYGVMRTGEKNTLAHRVSYTLARGPIPDGLYVLHRCDRPSCVNPEHLWLGTWAENNADMYVKGRNYTKLTREDVASIKKSTLSKNELAELYGVSRQTIGAIILGRSWKGVE